MNDFSYLLYSNVHCEFPRVSYFVMFSKLVWKKKKTCYTRLHCFREKENNEKNCLLWKTFSRTSQVNVIKYIPGMLQHHMPTS